jgi:hypothetical protein
MGLKYSFFLSNWFVVKKAKLNNQTFPDTSKISEEHLDVASKENK